MNTKQTFKKGFTIIEVVLVLAIAGLIFLMVFVALPALQAGQRDTARKNDVGSAASAVNTYASNNRGGFPQTPAALGTYNAGTGKWSGYASAISSNTTSLTVYTTSRAVTATQNNITIVNQSVCPATITGTGVTPTAGTSRQYIVVTYLEAGGGTAFCQDS